MTESLAIEIAGLKLANPTMLAAGILGLSGLTLRRVAEAGAGAVLTKSLGLNPRRGYQNPTVVLVKDGLVNAMGLPNPGIERFAQEMRETGKIKVPVIVSIYAFSPSEFGLVAKKALEIGAYGLELNVSCPHAEKTGAEIGQDPQLVEEVVREVKRNVQTPVFVKLTPNTAIIADLARAAERGGADGLTAINTLKAMVIDVETATPILGNKIGGLSGQAIKPIAVRCVYEIYKAVKIPIIGCGGVTTWRDAVEFMQAGASGVQIGTSIALKGLGVFRRITNGIAGYLKEKEFSNVKEIVGLAHEK